ncbi:MAG: aldo/keto reductase [Hyphomicrobiales bacterium]|nr:aldo/keto reductase [Hyphomicrobiales bacterium]
MNVSDKVTLRSTLSQPVELTRMGLGGAPLGNHFRRTEEPEAQATLQAAFDAGIRYFDTAPFYGFGRSEQRFGEAIARFGRENISLSTKIGRLFEPCPPDEVVTYNFLDIPNERVVYDYTYDGVMRSHEDSLKRLGVDQIDILLVHDVDIFTHGTREASDARVRELFDDGGYRALEEMKSAGVIKAIGAGLNEWQVCEKLLGLGEFDCFLLAGRYTLLEQEPLDSFLPLCEKRDVGIILGGPYNSGILATGPVEGARYNYGPAPRHVLEHVGKIEDVCKAHGVTLIEAALQFVMSHPAIRTVIPGAVSAAEVEMNVALFSRKLPTALWSDLKSAGLLRPDAPVPE